MRDARGQIAQRVQLLGVNHLAFQRAPVGDVAGNDDETDRVTGSTPVAHRADGVLEAAAFTTSISASVGERGAKSFAHFSSFGGSAPSSASVAAQSFPPRSSASCRHAPGLPMGRTRLLLIKRQIARMTVGARAGVRAFAILIVVMVMVMIVMHAGFLQRVVERQQGALLRRGVGEQHLPLQIDDDDAFVHALKDRTRALVFARQLAFGIREHVDALVEVGIQPAHVASAGAQAIDDLSDHVDGDQQRGAQRPDPPEAGERDIGYGAIAPCSAQVSAAPV